MSAATILMGTRDASWFDRPNTRTPKLFHIANDANMAVCDPRIPLVEESLTLISDVPISSRCHRPACAAIWRGCPFDGKRT